MPIYQTISCLLIQPNPDSALNATAGHLLQDDYEQFARQAKLMTSIHASIPVEMKAAALAARRRGEAPGSSSREEIDQRPTLKGKSASSSSVVMKKLPQRLIATHVPHPPRTVSPEIESDEEEDEASASKENDSALSPQPIPMQSPRRPTLAKRPLSDLPCPSEDEIEGTCISPSEQNVSNNLPQSLAEASTITVTRPGSQLSERDQLANAAVRNRKDASTHGTTTPLQDTMDAASDRPAKRICSDEAKENAVAEYSMPRMTAEPSLSTSSSSSSSAPATIKLNDGIAKAKAQLPSGTRKASAPGSLGGGAVKRGKARVGLRRL